MIEYRKIRKKQLIESETISMADWMIDNKCTIREVSKNFMIPKSTVHIRISISLKELDYDKWLECQKIMHNNKCQAMKRAQKAREEKRA